MFRVLCLVVVFIVFGFLVMYRLGMLILLVIWVMFISELSMVVGVFCCEFEWLWLCVLKLIVLIV